MKTLRNMHGAGQYCSKFSSNRFGGVILCLDGTLRAQMQMQTPSLAGTRCTTYSTVQYLGTYTYLYSVGKQSSSTGGIFNSGMGKACPGFAHALVPQMICWHGMKFSKAFYPSLVKGEREREILAQAPPAPGRCRCRYRLLLPITSGMSERSNGLVSCLFRIQMLTTILAESIEPAQRSAKGVCNAQSGFTCSIRITSVGEDGIG